MLVCLFVSVLKRFISVNRFGEHGLWWLWATPDIWLWGPAEDRIKPVQGQTRVTPTSAFTSGLTDEWSSSQIQLWRTNEVFKWVSTHKAVGHKCREMKTNDWKAGRKEQNKCSCNCCWLHQNQTSSLTSHSTQCHFHGNSLQTHTLKNTKCPHTRYTTLDQHSTCQP